MQLETKQVLSDYILCLMYQEGITALHVTDIIPSYRKMTWSQFPDLKGLLPEDLVVQEKATGWFWRLDYYQEVVKPNKEGMKND